MGGAAAPKLTSPRRGEVDAHSAAGEGARRPQTSNVPPHPALSPSGRGLFWSVAGELYLLPDDFQDSFGVFQHLVVPEADDTIAECFDDLGPRSIGLSRVLPAIEFDRQSQTSAAEIRDVRSDGTLPNELRAFESMPPKVVPEAVFGIGTSAAQLACDWRQALLRQCRAPSSQPSPRWEEGVRSAPRRRIASSPQGEISIETRHALTLSLAARGQGEGAIPQESHIHA